MIKVTALTASKIDPSSRFRIRQFIKPLAQLGVAVDEHCPLINRYRIEPLPALSIALRIPGILASRFTDVTWLGRELVSGRCTLEGIAGKRRVFDVDDAIWHPYEKDFSEEIVRRCAGVIAGNQYLADHYERIGARVWLVPTSVDTDLWTAGPYRDEGFTVGWIGSWSNLKFLYQIEEPLADFLSENHDARLLVVCDREPSFARISKERVQYARWSVDNEVELVQQMNVGLMPLDESESARGKCGFKMLSYMSVGLPVVVSPVGVNKEILERDEIGFAAPSSNEWYQALKMLHQEAGLRKRMGEAGRRVVLDHYSVKATAPKLAKIFREVAET